MPDTATCCTTVETCPLATTVCQVATCTNNVCGYAPAPATTLCRPSAGDCDVLEYCTGSSVECPADAKARYGTICSTDSHPCTADIRDGEGRCIHPAISDVPCNDNQICCTGTCCDPGLDCNPDIGCCKYSGRECSRDGQCCSGSCVVADEGTGLKACE